MIKKCIIRLFKFWKVFFMFLLIFFCCFCFFWRMFDIFVIVGLIFVGGGFLGIFVVLELGFVFLVGIDLFNEDWI